MWDKITRTLFGGRRSELIQDAPRLDRMQMAVSPAGAFTRGRIEPAQRGDAGIRRSMRAVPAYQPSLRIRFEGAATNLAAINIEAAQQLGLGSEQSSQFNVKDGVLKLAFSQSLNAEFPVQVLGSLDARDNSFVWGWANPTVAPQLAALSSRLRTLGETSGENMLVTSQQVLHFEEALPLIAFAAQEGGMPLVYRTQLEGKISAFLALGSPRYLGASGRSVASPFPSVFPGLVELDAAEAAVLEHDVQAHADGDRLRFVVHHPSDGVLHVRITEQGEAVARHIKMVGGRGRVVADVPGWGSGFLWPQS